MKNKYQVRRENSKIVIERLPSSAERTGQIAAISYIFREPIFLFFGFLLTLGCAGTFSWMFWRTILFSLPSHLEIFLVNPDFITNYRIGAIFIAGALLPLIAARHLGIKGHRVLAIITLVSIPLGAAPFFCLAVIFISIYQSKATRRSTGARLLMSYLQSGRTKAIVTLLSLTASLTSAVFLMIYDTTSFELSQYFIAVSIAPVFSSTIMGFISRNMRQGLILGSLNGIVSLFTMLISSYVIEYMVNYDAFMDRITRTNGSNITNLLALLAVVLIVITFGLLLGGISGIIGSTFASKLFHTNQQEQR